MKKKENEKLIKKKKTLFDLNQYIIAKDSKATNYINQKAIAKTKYVATTMAATDSGSSARQRS